MHPIELHPIEFISNYSTMFITHNSFKSPLTMMSPDSNEHFWLGVELAFNHPWVIVILEHCEADSDGDKCTLLRSIFLNDFGSIDRESFASESGATTKLMSAQLVIPSSEETGYWSMKRIKRVWTAELVDDQRTSIEVCETYSGGKHIITKFIDQNVEIENYKLMYEL